LAPDAAEALIKFWTAYARMNPSRLRGARLSRRSTAQSHNDMKGLSESAAEGGGVVMVAEPPTALREPSKKAPSSRGRKGAETRRRIMDATHAMLAARAFNEIRITDIARAANIAQPNFYTYFASIDDVIMALANEISADHLAVYLEPDWSGPDGLSLAMQFTEAALEMWQRHCGVFAVVGDLADKRRGDFAAVRVQQMRTIHKSFERKVAGAQAAGRIDPKIVPRLAGYECVSIIGSVGRRYDLMRASGFSHEDMVSTTARLLHLIATGLRP